MSKDEKIIPIGTDYHPEIPPPSQSDVQDIKYQLAIVLDELEILSKRVTQLTRIVASTIRKE